MSKTKIIIGLAGLGAAALAIMAFSDPTVSSEPCSELSSNYMHCAYTNIQPPIANNQGYDSRYFVDFPNGDVAGPMTACRESGQELMLPTDVPIGTYTQRFEIDVEGTWVEIAKQEFYYSGNGSAEPKVHKIDIDSNKYKPTCDTTKQILTVDEIHHFSVNSSELTQN